MTRTIVIGMFIIGLLSCESSSTVEEVVIIGGGLMGSSTGWQLSKQGAKVLLIERQDSVYTSGPYNGELVRDVAPYVQQLITPKRLFLAFLRINPTVYKRLSAEQQERLKLFYPVADINSEIFYSMGYLRMLKLPVQEEDLRFIGGYSCDYSLTESEVPYVANILSENGEVDPDFVLVGGMSGVGAKGSLTYGLIASDLLLQKTDSSAMYQRAVQALGTGRLSRDVNDLN